MTKYHYELTVLEKRALLPSDLKKALDELKNYKFAGLAVKGVSGTLERTGEAYVFTMRGSGRTFALQGSEDVRKLASKGLARVTLSGTVTQEDDKKPPRIELTQLKETP